MLHKLHNHFSLPEFRSVLRYVFRRSFQPDHSPEVIGRLKTREGVIPILLNPSKQHNNPISMAITTGTTTHWSWSLRLNAPESITPGDRISFYLGPSICSPYLIEQLEKLRKKRQITQKHLFKLFNQHHFHTDLCNRMISPFTGFSGNQFQNGLNLLIRVLFLQMVQQYPSPRQQQLKQLFYNPTLSEINQLFPEIFTLFSPEKLATSYHPLPETKEMADILATITPHLLKHRSSIVENSLHTTQFAITPNFIGSLFETIFTTHLPGTRSGRKKSGSYYTPIPVVSYMVEHLIFHYLNHLNIPCRTISELLYNPYPSIHPEDRKRLRHALENFTILDPAAGTGDFLVYLLNYITTLYQKLSNLDRTSILQKLAYNIYGIDILFGAANIARLRLLFLFLRESPPVEEVRIFSVTLARNIIVANTLLDQKKIDQTLPKNLSAIIGNPPYLGEKGNAPLFQQLKRGYLGTFYQSKIDLFYLFFHFALERLSPGGLCAYLTTNYYLTANSGATLRQDLARRSTILELFDFNESRLFPDAIGQHNLITLFQKQSIPDQSCTITRSKIKGYCGHHTLKSLLFSRNPSVEARVIPNRVLFKDAPEQIRFPVINPLQEHILEKLTTQTTPLAHHCVINQGLVTGCDRITPKHIKKFPELNQTDLESGIFMLDNKNQSDLNLLNKLNYHEQALIKPLFKTSDIFHYTTATKTSRKIIYCDHRIDPEQHPDLHHHLQQFYPVLHDRLNRYRERYHWSRLHRPRKKKIFTGAKIVAPQRASYNRFAFSTTSWFASADVYFITLKTEEDIDHLIYILTILNSKPLYLWLYHRGKRKGNLLELYHTPLSNLPIPDFSDEIKGELIDLGKKMVQNQQFDDHSFKKINRLIYHGYRFTPEEIELIEEIYPK